MSITDPDTGKTIGFLENISLGGMTTLGQDEIPATSDDGRSVELKLPTDTSDGGAIPLKVNNTWYAKDDNAGLHATGLEFVGTEVPALKQINSLMDELGSNTEDDE